MEQTTLPGIEERAYEPEFPTEKNGRRKGTARERAFARYYIETHRLAESARRAGYSAKNAHIIANRLIKKSLVADLIRAEEEAALKRAGVTAEQVLLVLANLANSDVRRLFREDGSLLNPVEWDDATAAAVSAIEIAEQFEGKGEERTQTGFVKKVRLWDKNKAVENLAKHLKLLTDKVDLSGEMDLAHSGSVVLLPSKMSPEEWAKAQEEGQG
ncbi:MAG: terminase small subunit [Thermodesulfobacteriota bacterium]